MKNNYTPVLVIRENKKELWRFDFSDLSIAELCKIKESIIKNAPYSGTIISLDSLIRQKTDEIIIHDKRNKKSYVKTYKENKKAAKMKKIRRKIK